MCSDHSRGSPFARRSRTTRARAQAVQAAPSRRPAPAARGRPPCAWRLAPWRPACCRMLKRSCFEQPPDAPLRLPLFPGHGLPHHLKRSVDPAPRPLPRDSPGWAPAAVPGSIARSILKGRRVQVARTAMSFAGSHARARGFALARRAPSLPPPGDVRSLVRGAKPRARRGVVVDLADLQIQARRRGAWAL